MNISNYLARQFMKNPKQRAFRSAVWVIALSVAPLVFIGLISQSMVDGIIARFIETYTYHLQAVSFGDFEFQNAKAAAEQLPEVRAVYDEVRSYGLAFSTEGRMSVELRGIDANLYQKDVLFRKYLTIEPENASLEEGEVWLGKESAYQLGVSTGDTLRLLVVSEDTLGVYQPKIIRATVTALVSTGYQKLDESWLFLSEVWAGQLLDELYNRRILAIKVNNPYQDLTHIRENVQTALGSYYLVYDWQTLNKDDLTGMYTSRGVLLFLLVIIVMVAVINTIGVLQLFYLEQLTSIATLTFLGMSRKQLFQFYLFVSFWASGVGALLGIVFGLFTTYGFVYFLPVLEQVNECFSRYIPFIPWPMLDLSFYLKGLEISLKWHNLLFVWFSIVMLTVAFSLVPAWRIVLMKPMQILRKV